MPDETNTQKAQRVPMDKAEKTAISAILLVALISIAIYLYLVQAPAQSTSAASALSQQQLNTTVMEQTTIQKVSAAPALNATYVGSFTAAVHLSLFSPKITLPIFIRMEKYGSDYRVDWNTTINALGLSLPINMSMLYLNRTAYLCIKAPSNSTLNYSGTTCGIAPAQLQDILSNVSSMATTAPNPSRYLNSSIVFQNAVKSDYDGQNCILVDGYGRAGAGIGKLTSIAGKPSGLLGVETVNSAGNFSECISPQYFLPLTFTAYGTMNFRGAHDSASILNNTSVTFNLDLQAQSINANVSKAYVTTLPGPILNTSQIINVSGGIS